MILFALFLFFVYPVIFGVSCILYFKYIKFKKHPIWFSIILPIILFMGYLQYRQLKIIGYCLYYVFKFIMHIILNIKKVCWMLFLYYIFYRVLKYNGIDVIEIIKSCLIYAKNILTFSIFDISIDSIIGFIQNLLQDVVLYIISVIPSVLSQCNIHFGLFDFIEEYKHIECYSCFIIQGVIVFLFLPFVFGMMYSVFDNYYTCHSDIRTRFATFSTLYKDIIVPINNDKHLMNYSSFEDEISEVPYFFFSDSERVIYYKYKLLNK